MRKVAWMSFVCSAFSFGCLTACSDEARFTSSAPPARKVVVSVEGDAVAAGAPGAGGAESGAGSAGASAPPEKFRDDIFDAIVNDTDPGAVPDPTAVDSADATGPSGDLGKNPDGAADAPGADEGGNASPKGGDTPAAGAEGGGSPSGGAAGSGQPASQAPSQPSSQPASQPQPSSQPAPQSASQPSSQPPAGDDETPSSAEVEGCRRLQGANGGAGLVRVIDGRPERAVKPTDILVVKLRSNSVPLELDLVGSSLRGLCMFLAGNQSKALVRVGLDLGRLVYLGTGNQSTTTLNVAKGAYLRSVVGSLRGNSSELIIEGEGTKDCAAASVSTGAKGRFDCK